MKNSREDQLKAFDRLLNIMDELRTECPWDKKQTLQSLRHLTIEETYELGDAILDNDLEEVKKELRTIEEKVSAPEQHFHYIVKNQSETRLSYKEQTVTDKQQSNADNVILFSLGG